MSYAQQDQVQEVNLPRPGSVPMDDQASADAPVKCPITREPCMLEDCAWFNPKTGYCFVTYLCLKF